MSLGGAVRVKICGITRLEDAKAAVSFGADAIGFVFAKSPRKISVQDAAGISSAVGPWVAKIGVFVNSGVREIMAVAVRTGLTAVQLHGDEALYLIRDLQRRGLCVIRAFRVAAPQDLKEAGRSPAAALLFDALAPGVYGGTGRRFDWELLKNFKTKKPVIVSGGLTPANVRDAIKTFSPYGVDVSSGVEKKPGIKDAGLIREFIRNAKKN